MSLIKRIFPAGWVEVDFETASFGIFFDNLQPDWRLMDMTGLTYPVSAESSAEYVELRRFAEALWAKNRIYEAIPDYDIPWQIYEADPVSLWKKFMMSEHHRRIDSVGLKYGLTEFALLAKGDDDDN